jgi:hypothetical protein
MLIFV